jgi:hypothetical protein
MTNFAAPDLRPLNPFHLLIDIIAAPGEALRRLSQVQTRSWWLPALLSLLAAFAYLGVTLEETAAEAAKQAQVQMGTMSAEQAAAAASMIERVTSPAFIFGSGAVATVLGLLIAWGLASLVLYLGASLAGGQVKIGRLWPAIVWIWLPFALRGFLQTAWSAANGSLIHYPGLSFWFATGDTAVDQTRPLFALAAQVDLFSLWHVALVYLLLRLVGRLGGGGAFAITLAYVVINLGVRLLPALVGGAFSLG